MVDHLSGPSEGVRDGVRVSHRLGLLDEDPSRSAIWLGQREPRVL